MKQENTTVNLEINKETKEALQEEANNKEMSLSGLIRFILKEHLKTKQHER